MSTSHQMLYFCPAYDSVTWWCRRMDLKVREIPYSRIQTTGNFTPSSTTTTAKGKTKQTLTLSLMRRARENTPMGN